MPSSFWRVSAPAGVLLFVALVASVACGVSVASDDEDGGPPTGGPAEPSIDGSIDASVDDASLPHDDADAAPSCDDGDPCTLDRPVDGGCEHPTAPDGTACNDRARCTGDDRCVAGVCRGTDFAPHVVPRGSFVGFGAPPNEDGPPLVGLGEPISDDEILFADAIGTRGFELSLVRAAATGLVRVATKRIDIGLGIAPTIGPDWSQRLATFAVPLGGNRTVIIASRQRLELFDTSIGKISSVTTFPLSPSSDTVVAAVGSGSRFYTCALRELATWEIDAFDVIRRIATFGTPDDCRSLWLSSDEPELLIASSHGIVRADVTDPQAVVFKPAFAATRAFWRIEATEAFIVGQRQGSFGEIRDIEIYRRETLAHDPKAPPEVTFAATAPGTTPSRLPVAFALVERGIAVEWKYDDANESTYTLDIRALPGGLASPATVVLRRERENRLPTSEFTIARRGKLLVVPPWRTVLYDDPVTRVTTPIHGAEQAGFESLSPRGVDRLTAFSGLAMHDVDVHDPDAPSVTTTQLPIHTNFFRWEPNGPQALTAPLGTPRGAVPSRPGVLPTTCFARAATGALSPSGTVNVVGGDFVFDVGPGLLQANMKTTGSFRLRWHDVPPACDGRTLTATVDGLVDLGLNDRRPLSWSFTADASGGPNAVLVEEHGTGRANSLGAIVWFEPVVGGTGWKAAARCELPAVLNFVGALRVHGDLAVIHDDRRVTVVRRKGATAEIVVSRDILDNGEPEELTDILRFDGELIYITTRRAPTGVVVLRARDLERMARFETHGVVRSMTEIGGTLAFGSASAIDLADSVCPP